MKNTEEQKKEARKTIRKKKNESFRKFVTTINKNTDITYIWNKMRFLRKGDCQMDWNSWKNKNRQEDIKEEIKKLSRLQVEEKGTTEEIEVKQEDRINKLNSEYRHEEFERALREVRKKSAPGKDRIDYEMIENMPNNMKKKDADYLKRLLVEKST